MTVHRIVFEGPTAIAISVATELADADGVDLISSDPPTPVGADTVKLALAVEGTAESVASAVAGIRDSLSPGASIELDDH